LPPLKNRRQKRNFSPDVRVKNNETTTRVESNDKKRLNRRRRIIAAKKIIQIVPRANVFATFDAVF